MSAIRYVAAILIVLLISPIVSAASFNCDKARTTTEKLICTDPSLSKLDEDLNAVYKRAIEVGPDKALVKQSQRDWLKSYDVTGCNNTSCLKDVFAARNELLKQIAPINSDTTSWSGNYVRYLNGQEDHHSASILLIGLIDKRIYASGTAVWLGGKSGQIHTGELKGVGKLQKNNAAFDLDGCKAKMMVKRSVLLVEDESGCGGLNVTFNGEYRKKCDDGSCLLIRSDEAETALPELAQGFRQAQPEREFTLQKPEAIVSSVNDSLPIARENAHTEILPSQTSTNYASRKNITQQTINNEQYTDRNKKEDPISFWAMFFGVGLFAGIVAIIRKAIVTIKMRKMRKILNEAYDNNTEIGKFQSDDVYIKSHLKYTKRENKSHKISSFNIFVPISKCDTTINKAHWNAQLGVINQSAYANAMNMHAIAYNRYQNDKSQFEARESAKWQNNTKYQKAHWTGRSPSSPSKNDFVNYSPGNGVTSANIHHGWKIPCEPNQIVNKNNVSCPSPIDEKIQKIILNIYKDIINKNLKGDFDNTFDGCALPIDKDYVFEQEKDAIYSEIERKSNLGEYYKNFTVNILEHDVVISITKYLPIVIVSSSIDAGKIKTTIHDSIVSDAVIQ